MAPEVPRYAERTALGLVALGLALRLHGFFEPWLNPDEGIYFEIATAPGWSDFLNGVAGNAHPPLQYLLLRSLAGVSGDFAVLRAPSLVAGVLAIFAMFRLGCETAGWRSGLVGAFALAASPGAILLSQVMRPYALLLALLTASSWLALRHLRTGSTRDLALHTLLLTLAALTHYTTYVTVPVFAAVLIGDALSGRRPRALLARRAASAGLLGVLALASYVVHLRPHLLGRTLQTDAQSGWLAPFFPDGPLEAWLGLVGVQRYLFGQRCEAIVVVALVLGAVLLLRSRHVAPVALSLGTLACAALLAGLEQLPLGSTRHSAYLAVFVIPIAAVPFAFAWRAGPLPVAAAIATTVIAATWPGPLRAATGAARLTTRNTIEHVASAASVRAGVERLEELVARPGLVVMDRQTFAFLAPVLRGLSDPSRYGRGEVLAGFRWHRADVVVARAWTLRVGDRHPLAPGHLAHLLQRAEEALPRLGIADRRDGALVAGGWHVERYRELVATDRQLARGGPGAVLAWEPGPGLAIAILDWQRYRSLVGLRSLVAPHDRE